MIITNRNEYIDFSLRSTISVCLMDNGETHIVMEGKKWNLTGSQSARNTINPIRRIVDRCILLPCPDKRVISLSIGELYLDYHTMVNDLCIGDPTSYGNMLPPIEARRAMNDAFEKPTSHGYTPSCGK